jgi:hypothetical protein
MSELRFEEEEQQPLKSQRMTDEEAKAVIELWADKHREEERMRTLPSVQDVAAGLDIPTEEAYKLLQQVRARDTVQRVHHQELVVNNVEMRRKMTGPVLAVAVALMIAILLMSLLTVRHAAIPPPAPAAVTVPIQAPVPSPPTPEAGSTTAPTSAEPSTSSPGSHPTGLPR